MAAPWGRAVADGPETTQEGVAVMHAADLLTDAFGRVRDTVHEVVTGLTPDQMSFRLDDGATRWPGWCGT